MKFRNLVKNTLIFAFGNIFSKIIIFLLLPLFTSYYSTSEFGTIDLFTILLSLFLPLISLSTFEYLLKEVSENSTDKKRISKVLTSILAFSLSLLIVFFIICITFYFILENVIILYLFIAVSLQVVVAVLKNLYRALEYNLIFIASDIFYSLIFGLLVVSFIFLGFSYHYYFIAVIIGFLIQLIFLITKKEFISLIKLNLIDFQLIADSIKYSFPLMLNSLMWYIINISNRYFILFFINISAVGIFAANMRIPTIIALLYSYLYKAVQIIIFKSPNDNYNGLLNIAFGLLFLVISLLTIFNDFIVNILISEDFRVISNLLPFMYLSALFSSYASLLGINFQVANKTKLAFSTSMYAGIFSLILNIILIPLFGLHGAVFSMLFSFIFMVVLRLAKKEYIIIKLNNLKLTLSTILIFILFLTKKLFLANEITLLILTIIVLLMLYKDDLKNFRKGEI